MDLSLLDRMGSGAPIGGVDATHSLTGGFRGWSRTGDTTVTEA
jgi:hypothetical protein